MRATSTLLAVASVVTVMVSGFVTRRMGRPGARLAGLGVARGPSRAFTINSRPLIPAVQNFLQKDSSILSFRGGSVGGFGYQSRLMATQSNLEEKPVMEAVQHPSYEVVGTEYVREYDAVLWQYRHKKTGAQVLSVGIDDDNKVFGVVFRTPPEDSTGLPHILEHSVLCGSRKYPTKEPFVELLKGSLQTFLNAFTYPDRTCYPVASQNTKDFYNLMNVYLDAVFFPRAINDPQVLAQEGWHYELEQKDQPLTYKGVVFNEMKGVYSSPDARMSRQVQRELFSSNTYHVDSGGDPTAIPNLTFQDFKNFHGRFYHPSNARVYFYGDDDPLERLNVLDDYLSEFEPVDPNSAIQWEKKKDAPWKKTSAFPASEEDVKKGQGHMVTVNWLLNDAPFTQKEQLTVSMLDYLLLNDISSPLYRSLLESNLGSAVIGGGLSSELLQSTYNVGLKGVKAEKAEEVEPLILSTLERIAEEGFPQDAIDACVNSIEFSLREFNTGSFPRGLSFMLGTMREWIYDGNPADGVRFDDTLAELKADLEKRGGQVFVDALKELLLDNGHRLTMTMVPDASLEAKIVKEEEDRLAAVKAELTDADLDRIIQETEELRAAQAAEDPPEAKASIPALTIDDLERKAKTTPIEVRKGLNGPDGGALLVTHELPSNGILYADVGLDLSSLAWEDVPLMSLFSDMLLECGTNKEDETTLTRRIGRHTGGVRSAILRDLVEHPEGKCVEGDEIVHYLFLRGKAVPDKVSELFAIMKDILTDVNLDRQSRVIEMLRETKASMESSIVTSGHAFAASRLAAHDTGFGVLREQTGGVTYLNTVRELLEQAENEWPSLLSRLQKIQETLLNSNTLVVNLTGDKEVLSASVPVAETFATDLPKKASVDVAADRSVPTLDLRDVPRLPAVSEGLVVPTQVNYVGMAGRIYQPGDAVDSSAFVINNFLRTGHIWDTVRVMGGAYGGFCSFDRLTGRLGFLSYRDPNLMKTLENYKASADHLLTAELTEKSIEQAVIGSIGDLDSPRSVDTKGWLSLADFLAGRSDELRQKRRDEVFATDLSKFREFGEKLSDLNKADPTVVVVGSAKAIEEANKDGLGLKVVNVL
uniref:Peptidase M16C associated domain-containing protein n=1 Tax=Pinguiococcus pyrenoidosus TaxID=172671 RepID=A0A7R9U8K2_9STRA|mmetsp:Transcript_19181/g.72471  ORF Transcript_19181/g.72471 Transcript_19181/m.72471 type:complete len:1099 (+) Transcript_19181:84-3380(+)